MLCVLCAFARDQTENTLIQEPYFKSSILNASPHDADALSPRAIGLAALVLAGMIALVFWDVLLFGDARVLSKIGCDVFGGTLAGREYAFDQLRQGNFMLWCPAVLGGSPSFGGFQSWLAYPLAFPHLLLSAAAAINWTFVLHTFLGGMFTYLWLGRQSLHRHACLAGALMFAFCAPFYLRIYVGHPTVHAATAWIPLVLLAIDELVAAPSLGGLLLGATAVSMQLLAGYPQVLFYTAIAAGLYTLAAISAAPRIWKSVLYLILMNVLALGLTCVQWAAGMAMAEECVRRGGVPYEFAAGFSLPPENWLTLIRPGLLGDREAFPYWGRWYLWEMCLYFGTIGLFFTVVGLWHTRRQRVLTVAVICVALGVLAMGSHAPHFRFFYEHVPGFNMFRGNSKFIIPLVTFLIFLSAHGMDMLFREDARQRLTTGVLIGAVSACAVLAALIGLVAFCGPQTFGRFMAIPLNSAEMCETVNFTSPDLVSTAARFCADELRLAQGFLGGLTVALGLLAWRPRWRPWLAIVIVGLLALELLRFAQREHVSFAPELVRQPALQRYLEANLSGDRIFSLDGSNVALTMDGVSDLWGYGSDAVVRRYAEFLAFSQGNNPDRVTGYQAFTTVPRRLDLLRCRYALIRQADGSQQVVPTQKPLPKFLLVRDWQVEPKRDAIFAALNRADFDPQTAVFLERPPTGMGAETNTAVLASATTDPPIDAVRILRENTDWQEVEVKLAVPAILVQSDLYTPNWHVYALAGSARTSYELMPANYILRAVPLPAGMHRLRIEYRPAKFVAGRCVSLASLVGFAGLVSVWGRRRWKVSADRVTPPAAIRV